MTETVEISCQDCFSRGYTTGLSAGMILIDQSVENQHKESGDVPTVESYQAAISLVRQWLKRQAELARIEAVSSALIRQPGRVQ